MDPDKAKDILYNFFTNYPSKDAFEKALIELIAEKSNVMSNEEYDKDYIEKMDKVIESIQVYLSIVREKDSS